MADFTETGVEGGGCLEFYLIIVGGTRYLVDSFSFFVVCGYFGDSRSGLIFLGDVVGVRCF